MLQGSALAATLELLRALSQLNAAGLEFETLLEALFNTVSGSAGSTLLAMRGSHIVCDTLYATPHVLSRTRVPSGERAAQANVARCVAALCAHATSAQRQSLLTQLLTPSNDVEGTARHLQLLCVGEIGRLHDVYATHNNCFDTLYAAFTSSNEAVKSAAAFALGKQV